MFQKTKRQLAFQYAGLLLLILGVLISAVYFYVKSELLAKVDETLNAKLYGTVRVEGQKITMSTKATASIDPRVFTVLQDGKGNLTQRIADSELDKNQLNEILQMAGKDEGLVTVKVDGHFYRISTSNQESQLKPYVLKSAATAFPYIYAIANVDSEMNLLHSLMIIMIAAGIVGSILVIFAGQFMANRALIPIRNAWEQQQQFVADASHELRTPLAIIGSSAELLLRHPTHTIEQESDQIAPILKETQRMTKLVTQLLTLARSDSNQLELQIQPLFINELAEETVEQFRPLCEMKGLTLSKMLESPITVHADKERVKQLIMILMDNALKYTPEGGTIKVSCFPSGSGARLQIADTGIGIQPDELPKVFDRFFRGDEARNRAEGGTGLGLSIAKWIVDKHGGIIRASSVPSEGTTINVTFAHGK